LAGSTSVAGLGRCGTLAVMVSAMPYDRDSRGGVAPPGRKSWFGEASRMRFRGSYARMSLRLSLHSALYLSLGTLLLACGPSVKPPSPPAEPEPISKGAPTTKVDPSGRRVVVGEMCPQGAGGRPAVAPLIMRGVGWADTTSEVAATVERGQVPRFVVFGVDGKPAGTFEALGMVEVGIAQPVATGTYVGASPCTYGGSK